MNKSRKFVVYELYFENSNKIYIGKTYNIKSRINTHIKEALAKKYNTYKNNWIRKHLHNDEQLKYKILYETSNEQDAYEVEHKLILKTSNYNVNCFYNLDHPSNRSTKGLLKMAEIFGKDYILITKNRSIIEVKSLSKFGRDNNLNYKDLNACAKKKLKSSQGYKVFYRNDWLDLTLEERAIEIENFKCYDQYKTKEFLESGNNLRKKYVIINPHGIIEEIIGLSTYIKKNKLNDGNMFSALSKQRPCKGYQVFYKKVWDDLLPEDKSKYIAISKNYTQKKQYKITDPSGKVKIITGLKDYCLNNNLHQPSLSSLAHNKINKYKGYKIEIIDKGLQDVNPVANPSNSGKLLPDNAEDNPERSPVRERATTSRETYTQVSGNGGGLVRDRDMVYSA